MLLTKRQKGTLVTYSGALVLHSSCTVNHHLPRKPSCFICHPAATRCHRTAPRFKAKARKGRPNRHVKGKRARICAYNPALNTGIVWPLFATGTRREKGRGDKAPACRFLVAPTGFEPATSALRGRRPKPLDDGAT